MSREECLRVAPDRNEFLRMIGEPPEQLGAAPAEKAAAPMARR